MPCDKVAVPGGFAIVCSRGRPPARKCFYCSTGTRTGTQLCDGPGAKPGRTCDRPLCRRHAHHVEPDRDYCRDHVPLQATLPVGG